MKRYCVMCGTVAEPELTTRGSCLIELILYLFFIVPGIIYSIWRRSVDNETCPSCGGDMIPLDSPRAKEALADRGETNPWEDTC